MARTSITVTTEIDLSIEAAAGWFAGLTDEQQADFFIKVSAIAKSWTGHQGGQWYLVGRHLQNCACSTPEARMLVDELHNGLTSSASELAQP